MGFVELAESAVTGKGQHAVWFERQPRVLSSQVIGSEKEVGRKVV